MAASIIIEQESGTFSRPLHRHNGYYAGDFSAPAAAPRTAGAPGGPTRQSDGGRA